MIIINERQRNILNYLISTTEDYIVVSTIAEKLNVSCKTIYRDIQKLNQNEKFHIKSVKGKGIKIQILDRSILSNDIFKKINISKRRYDIYYELLISSPVEFSSSIFTILSPARIPTCSDGPPAITFTTLMVSRKT